MGACISTKSGPTQFVRTKPDPQLTFSKQQSMLLDMWHEKHIQILKQRFNDSFTNRKQSQNVTLDYNSFLRVFDHTKKEGYEQGSSIFKLFGQAVCKQAFLLFNRNIEGELDFRNFCCALSIICLGSRNEKFRFIFDLFDIDCDGFLSRKEILFLLNVLSQLLIEPQVLNSSRMRVSWVDVQSANIVKSVNKNSDSNRTDTLIDFSGFKQWAESKIDICVVLKAFELVPSPLREQEIISQILQNHPKKHGDTMYALSYRWWDTWKEYTERHSTTVEVRQQQERIKDHISHDPNISEEVRQCLLKIYQQENGEDEDKIPQLFTGEANFRGNEQEKWSQLELAQKGEDVLELSHSMQQQLALINSRSIILQNSSFMPTPRKTSKLQSNASLGDSSHREDIDQQNPHIEKRISSRALQPNFFQNRSNLLLQKRVQSSTPLSGQIQANLTVPDEPDNYNSHQSNNTPISQVVSKRAYNILVKNQNNIHQKANDLTAEGSLQNLEDEGAQTGQQTKIAEDRSPENFVGYTKKKISKVVFKSSKEAQQDLYSSSIARLDSNFTFHHKEFPRPPSIDNSEIEGEHPGQLMPNLIMFRDFVILPETAWNILCTWYGKCENSPDFGRKILIHNSIPSLELYPPHIMCILADTEGKPVPDSQKSLFVSSALSLGEVHLKICELFNYISTRDTRLWVKGANQNSDNEWKLVDQSNHNLKDGDIFMVEVKFYGNQWSMDSQKVIKKREWQQFEIGDKIDVNDAGVWKVGNVNKVLKDSLQIHLLNKNYKHDITVRKDSQLLAKFGQHTLAMHFKQNQEVSLVDRVNGIHNIGNTCYMNACVQSLLHTPLYRDFFKTQSFKLLMDKNKKEDMISQAFCNLVDTMLAQQSIADGQSYVVDPSDFKKAINTTLPLFFGNQQHDAAEFLNFMLDKMSEEMNRSVKEQAQATLEPVQSALPQNQDLVYNQSAQRLEHDSGEMGGTGNSKTKNVAKTIAVEGPTNFQPVSHPESDRNGIPVEVKQGFDQLLTLAQRNQVDEKLQLEQNELAISEAKQSVYDEYFVRPTIQKSSQKNGTRNGPQTSFDDASRNKEFPDSFDPNITPTLAKAKQAWYQALKQTNSPITDLFVGQQMTQISCMACNNKSFTFENFYSLPVPLPANFNTTFYVTIVRRATISNSKTQLSSYGVQINKFKPLSSLYEEIRKVSRLDQNFAICELAQNKIYRLHEDLTTNLFFISKRTNQLYFYETLDVGKLQKDDRKLRKSSSRFFNSFEEIEPGMIVDACDQQNKWYVAIITAKEQGTLESRVRIHFYHLNESWDEWIDESDSNLQRLRPLNSTGRAKQPPDQVISVTLTQRRVKSEGQAESQIPIGLPYYLVIPNFYSWKQLSLEITNQIFKHVKLQQTKHSVFKFEHEAVSDELEGPGLNLQSNLEQSPQDFKVTVGDSSAKIPKIITNSQQKHIQPMQQIQRKGSISNDANQIKPKASRQLDTILEKPLEQSFKIKLYCAETQKCAFCLLKQRFDQQNDVCKSGCEIPQSNDMIKWITCLYKNLEIFVDWIDNNGQQTYQEAEFHRDVSYLRYKKMESEVVTGIPLGACLDLYSKKEKIDGYQCDHCKSQTSALLKPLISHLPDILILHLKRFNFDGGYLDKIEDLVTFPIRNLDMQKYTINGTKGNTVYDLYAVVNHHIYQTGGHYTANVQIKTQNEPIWVLTNDSTIAQLANPIVDIVKKDAYILFYRKRELTPSNLLKLGDTL